MQSLLYSQIRQGIANNTKGTAFVVYEDVMDAKQACDKLNGFNFQNRYLVGTSICSTSTPPARRRNPHMPVTSSIALLTPPSPLPPAREDAQATQRPRRAPGSSRKAQARERHRLAPRGSRNPIRQPPSVSSSTHHLPLPLLRLSSPILLDDPHLQSKCWI